MPEPSAPRRSHRIRASRGDRDGWHTCVSMTHAPPASSEGPRCMEGQQTRIDRVERPPFGLAAMQVSRAVRDVSYRPSSSATQPIANSSSFARVGRPLGSHPAIR